MNCPYRQIATERWPGLEINGNGRYALVAHKDGRAITIYLTSNRAAAEASSLFYDSKVFDLQPCPVLENCPDRFPD